MKDILDYKCPNCSAPLLFNSSVQKMKCNSCETEMDTEDFKAYDEALKSQDGVSDLGSYKASALEEGAAQLCQSCHGELLTDGVTVATECPYCGNTAIIKQKVSNCLRPDFVIPFKLDKEKAKARLKEFYNKKPLLPKCFKDTGRFDKLQGIYVPFWLYDCETLSNAAYDAERVKVWTTGNTRYTRREKYLITREGTMRFEKIPVDGSEKMDDTVMESIEPYDNKELTPFSMAYLSGFLADKHDTSFEKQHPRIQQRMNASIDNALSSTVHGYSNLKRRSLNVNVRNGRVSYAMYPVWLINTKWKDKMYTFTMNGQTGKAAGTLPIDWKKGGIIGFTVFALLTALLIGLSFLTDNAGLVPFMPFVGLGVAAAVVFSLKAKMKSVKRSPCARDYQRDFNLTKKRDILVSSRTTSVRIQQASTAVSRGIRR